MDPRQILLGLLHSAHRRFLAALVLGDARRFFDKLSALLRFRLHERRDAVLLHKRIRPGADAGPHEKLPNVEQAAGNAVYGVFAFAVPEYFTGNHNLIAFRVDAGEAASVRRKRHGDFGHSDRRRPLGAIEDNVLHFLAAQGFDALFAHHPTNGVNNIALPATVGTDDAGNAVGEIQHRLLTESLKASNFKSFQFHRRCASKVEKFQRNLTETIGLVKKKYNRMWRCFFEPQHIVSV
jgi:hypothetical protein